MRIIIGVQNISGRGAIPHRWYSPRPVARQLIWCNSKTDGYSPDERNMKLIFFYLCYDAVQVSRACLSPQHIFMLGFFLCRPGQERINYVKNKHHKIKQAKQNPPYCRKRCACRCGYRASVFGNSVTRKLYCA